MPRRSSNRSSNPSILTSHETGVAASTSGDEALEYYALHSDGHHTSPNTPDASTSARAPLPPPNDFRPTNPPGNNSPNIMGQTPADDQGIEITGPANVDELSGDSSSARRTSDNKLRSADEQLLEPVSRSAPDNVTSSRSRSPHQASPSNPAAPTRPTEPSQTEPHFNSFLSDTSTLSDLTSLPSSPAAPPDMCPKDDYRFVLEHPIPPPVAATDEIGQYEFSTCHQCRAKTTRPKMICDRSQDSSCFNRVCDRCLTARAVYGSVPELQPPIFEFVPGGSMLCVKCRGVCPCVYCRRNRGENEQNRRGLHQGLTSQGREKELLRNKRMQEKAKLKKESGRSAGLRDSAPAKRKRASTVPPAARKKGKKEGSDQSPANFAGNSNRRTASVNRSILSAGGDSIPANTHNQLSQRSSRTRAGSTNLRTLIPRSYTIPQLTRDGRPKAKPGPKKRESQTLPSQVQNEIDPDLDKTLVDQPLQSDKRLEEAAPAMTSLLPSEDSPGENQTFPSQAQKETNPDLDKTLIDQPLQSDKRLEEAAPAMTSLLPSEDSPGENQTFPSQAQKETNPDLDKTLIDQPLQSDKRLEEAAPAMTSLLHSEDSPSDPEILDQQLSFLDIILR
ncbi:hypothetical protein PtA15_17A208 [Puccinia triticina]|uniref:Zinc-finger domain-containing protein n=1 Tax=Puccinia triticina TaxID=208348 RepID=A0ABY7D8S2_9BASI|nr:uncharacterized protein PtA15_17A208 [Puccinia triticina]WAQ92726.1 hypothetical protein PtA15_17A208 [Puccinia triticina]